MANLKNYLLVTLGHIIQKQSISKNRTVNYKTTKLRRKLLTRGAGKMRASTKASDGLILIPNSLAYWSLWYALWWTVWESNDREKRNIMFQQSLMSTHKFLLSLFLFFLFFLSLRKSYVFPVIINKWAISQKYRITHRTNAASILAKNHQNAT